MSLEREYKFSLSSEAIPTADELRAVFTAHQLSLGAAELRMQDDCYFDTPHGALRRAGVAFRERKVNGQRLATFKGAGVVQDGLHQREELELPLEDDTWPTAIRHRLAEITSLVHLQAVLELTTRRTSYQIGLQGEAIAELSIDEVAASYPDGKTSVHFVELELELLGAPSVQADKVLTATVADLQQALPLSENSTNKLERALALLSLGEELSQG